MTEAEKTETIVDGRYRLHDRIGSGGMADVYRAEDTQLERDVALKVLHRRFARDEQFVERFRREASSAAALQHPHVVNVFDRGEYDDTYYIAMEHLEGRTLKALINEEAPLAQERAIDIGIQILEAAGFAHSRGVIHRDFKPQNVIIDENDDVKVTDFGIARAGASEITETGSILGTAQYLSPEQAQGRPTGQASDLYSIGVILYELLAGRLPFEGDSTVAVAVKHLSEEPPRLASFRPDVHPGLEAAVMRTLAKEPENRFASAEELVATLQAARAQIAMGDQGQGTAIWGPLPADGATPPPDEEKKERGRWRRRLPWLLIPLLLAAAIGAFLLLRGPAQVPVPDVVGDTLGEAQPALEEAGFEVEVEEREDEATVNDVLAQDPEAGSEIDEGSTVTLVVSEGPGEVRVPDVVGLSQEQATRRLNRRELDVETEEAPSVDVPEGSVISTSPPAGTRASIDSTVRLFISTGPRSVQVPGVIGQPSDTASVNVENAGLAATIEEVESDAPEGEVVDQDPGGGTTVDEGTTVTLTVSTGPPPEPDPEPDTVTVPGVIGQSESSATSSIEGAGLSASVSEQTTDDQSQDGVVIDQSPGAGRELEEGGTVTIVVGRFEEEEPVDPVDPPDEPGGGRQNPRDMPPGEQPPRRRG